MDTPAEAEGRPPQGTIRGAAGTLVELLGTRVELFGVELREETRHLQEMLVRGFIAALLLGCALVMAGVAVVVAFWDTHRMLAACGVTLLYAAGGVILFLGMRSSFRERPAAFKATVEEFQADLGTLRRREEEEAK